MSTPDSFDARRPHLGVDKIAAKNVDVMRKIFVREYSGEIAGHFQAAHKALQPGQQVDLVKILGLYDPQNKKNAAGSEASRTFFNDIVQEIPASIKRKVGDVKIELSFEEAPLTPKPDTEYLLHVRKTPRVELPGEIIAEFRLQKINRSPKDVPGGVMAGVKKATRRLLGGL